MRSNVLGKGGHAIVRRAVYQDRTVAHKCARTLQNKSRIIHEGDVLAELPPHPNLVGFYGADEGELYIEYIDGLTLHELSQRVTLSDAEVVYIISEVLEALAHVHDSGFVHCDLSPNNIIISRTGEVKLIDLGAARRQNEEGERTAATLAYASPELLRHRNVDGRSDLYSVGVILYELISRCDYSKHVRLDHLINDQPAAAPLRTIRPTAPIELDQAMSGFLALAAAERFATAQQAQAALPNSVLGRSELCERMRTKNRPGRSWRRPAALAATASLCCVAGTLLLLLVSYASSSLSTPLPAKESSARIEESPVHSTAQAVTLPAPPPPEIETTQSKPRESPHRKGRIRSRSKSADKILDTAAISDVREMAPPPSSQMLSTHPTNKAKSRQEAPQASPGGEVVYHDPPQADEGGEVVYVRAFDPTPAPQAVKHEITQ